MWVVVVSGVAGAGKSTVGRRLAAELGVEFAEGDAMHPAANVAKMARGEPLDDADRAPWLALVADWIESRAAVGGVVSCSALRYCYREVLRGAGRDHPLPAWVLQLRLDRELATRRVARRPGHFMPASLVESQLATFEPLRPDEPGLVVESSVLTDEIVRRAVAALRT